MTFRTNNSVVFETEMLLINSITPMAVGAILCFFYFLLTSSAPDMWVVGISFNVCWILSLREAILTSYLQGVSDTVAQSPYIKPYLGVYTDKTAPEISRPRDSK